VNCATSGADEILAKDKNTTVPIISNSKILLDFDFSRGISLLNISDPVAHRDYLRSPSMLFEFAANNGPPQESDTGLRVLTVEAADSASLTVAAVSVADPPLSFELQVTLAPDSAAATLQLTVFTSSEDPIFLRVVFPKIRGIVVPGGASALIGAIPQEAGWVAPLSSGVTLGMPFTNLAPRVGLPISFNNMEVASIFDGSQGGGVFFCDLDGELDNGVPPLEFNLSAAEVVAFWIGDISQSSPGHLSRLAIGVHPEGDWHAAVDFYNSVHRPSWSFPSTPEWFRDAAAIYSPTGLTAGGIYLLQATSNLADGAVWNTWEDNDRAWSDGRNGNASPVQVSPGGFAPAGVSLRAVAQNSKQVDVFAAGWDGAVWVTWEAGDGLWRNNRHGLTPARITPAGFVNPGIPLVCGQQGNDQLDVFFVREDGAVWVTWERGDNAWTDGLDGRAQPAKISPASFVRQGAHLAAAKENDNQLDLFVIRDDGAIWFSSVIDYGLWDVWVRITPTNLFPSAAPIVAIKQNNDQLNVFSISNQGAVLTTWRGGGGDWAPEPVAVTPQNFASPTSYLAAAKQNDRQLDVFFVRDDGAIWVTWESGDGLWTDGVHGYPKPVSTAGLAPGGAPVAAAKQGANQLDAFVVGNDGAIWVTWERDDGGWTDGMEQRPGPAQITPLGFTLPGSDLAVLARSDSHVDAFTIGKGRIRSFLEMPQFLAEANALGTNIVYLTDYWEGADEGGGLPFWNKGDYSPRADLGGESALIEGIDAVHRLGGKVILYLEPFIIYKFSAIGKSMGEGWAGRDDDGNPWMDYPDNYSMVAPFDAWQQYVANTARRLLSYGADGIFLDSYAWQMNRPMYCNDEGVRHSAQDYAAGVLTVTDAVRAAVPSIFNETIVMGETTAGPIARHWDGGVNADFGFGNIWKIEKLIASPVRYGIPEVHMFGNGTDLNGLQQFYAAGHGLALCSYWNGTFMYRWGSHIAELVQIRVTYKDALIHGAQINQPPSDNPDVIAYQYQGTSHRMLTIVHIVPGDTSANITLGENDERGFWIDLLTGAEFSAPDGILSNVALSSDDRAIRVLLHRQRPFLKSTPLP
jgi:hypothetical protein